MAAIAPLTSLLKHQNSLKNQTLANQYTPRRKKGKVYHSSNKNKTPRIGSMSNKIATDYHSL
jgi:hypothetical protein